jgi:predicted nucleotidyltransferase
MAILSKQEIIQALEHLGRLAQQQEHSIELLVMGGAAIVLLYNARPSTRDVDVFILSPRKAQIVRELARQVAQERDLPEDWLNDGAKGYLMGASQGAVVLSAPGIVVRSLAVPQLLAMKLSAWRDDVDIQDARRLLQELRVEQEQVWAAVEPYLVPGTELKAQYAFSDLWETTHGTD